MKILFGAFAVMLVVACSQPKKEAAKSADTFYTCSMHPQVMEAGPGKCPICHMDLIAAKKGRKAGSGDLELTPQQVTLGNIRVDTIGMGAVGDEMVLNATLAADQNRMEAVSARVAGRIDRLYFKNIGDYIPKGARLADIYSELLNNAKQEYVASLQKKELLDNSLIDFDRLIAAAKNKLMLWGMSEVQINQLAKTQKVSPITSIFSSAGGYVTALDVTEGQYVEEGSTVVRLANLSSLWAEAQLYSSQRSYLNSNVAATVSFPDLPGEVVAGKITFANPELSPDSRINLLRVIIPNPEGKLKPGMSAYVTVNNRNESSSSLYLPVDAVLQDSKGASVWVKTGKNTFRNKMVTIGAQSGDRIEIRSGLQKGEAVVTSGAYLINSEYIFKQGADPMAGMSM